MVAEVFLEAFPRPGSASRLQGPGWASRSQVLYRILAAEVHLIDGIKHILGCGRADAVYQHVRKRIHVCTQK